MQGLVTALLRKRLRVLLLVVSLHVIDHLIETKVVLLDKRHVEVSRVHDELLGFLVELPAQFMPDADGRNAFNDGEAFCGFDLELLEDPGAFLAKLQLLLGHCPPHEIVPLLFQPARVVQLAFGGTRIQDSDWLVFGAETAPPRRVLLRSRWDDWQLQMQIRLTGKDGLVAAMRMPLDHRHAAGSFGG